VTLVNRGADPVDAVITTIAAPSQPLRAGGDGFTIDKSYYTLEGEPVSISSVEQNQRFVVVLQMSEAASWTSRVIVTDLLPAGFEIETVLRAADGDRPDNGTDGAFSWLGEIDEADTAEARDDRFVAAIDVRDEPVRLAYVVRAVTPGAFTMPGVNAEDMYRPDVFARSAPGRITIDTQGAAAGGQR